MLPPRIRFTIRSLIIGVALTALNLAGAMATAGCKGGWGSVGIGWGNLYVQFDRREEYNVGCFYRGPYKRTNGEYGAWLTEVWRGPLPPTRLQVWSPILASTSITILVLIIGSWDRGAPPRRAPPDAGGGQPARCPRLWPAVRWLPLGMALMALNLAGAIYRPAFDLYKHDANHPADPAHEEWQRANPWARNPVHTYKLKFVGSLRSDLGKVVIPPGANSDGCLVLDYHDLFIGIPTVLNIEMDGTLVERCAMEAGEPRVDGVDGRGPAGNRGTRLPAVIFQDSLDGEATIDFRADGGIVAYAGRAGKVLSPPRFLRTPTFSFLEMRWPIIASAAITVLAFILILRHLSPRQIQSLVIVLALASINTAAVFASLTMREPPRLLSQTWSNRAGEEKFYSDGSRLYYVGGSGVPKRVTRVERPNPPPTFLQTWWPVIAGGSITILALGALWHRSRGR